MLLAPKGSIPIHPKADWSRPRLLASSCQFRPFGSLGTTSIPLSSVLELCMIVVVPQGNRQRNALDNLNLEQESHSVLASKRF